MGSELSALRFDTFTLRGNLQQYALEVCWVGPRAVLDEKRITVPLPEIERRIPDVTALSLSYVSYVAD
jgi:hypothetical protein